MIMIMINYDYNYDYDVARITSCNNGIPIEFLFGGFNMLATNTRVVSIPHN